MSELPHPEGDEFDDLSVAGPLPGHGTSVDRRWAVATHLSIFPCAIAFPLVVVLTKGERSAYVAHHAVEALNFQTTVVLAVLVCALTAAATAGLLLLPLVLLAAAALSLHAASRSRRGAWHRYPFTVRLVS
jgi:uncharacterized protein